MTVSEILCIILIFVLTFLFNASNSHTLLQWRSGSCGLFSTAFKGFGICKDLWDEVWNWDGKYTKSWDESVS